MNTFMIIIYSILFLGIPTYYLTILFSTYYKDIYKNKEDLKLNLKVTSLSVYLSVFILIITWIIFTVYSVIKKENMVLIIPMLLIIGFVSLIVNLTSSKVLFYTNYVMVKNLYVEYTEINNVLLKPLEKENFYELSISTKDYLHICEIKVEDTKTLLKQIKTLLPKNIKIKEVPAK